MLLLLSRLLRLFGRLIVEILIPTLAGTLEYNVGALVRHLIRSAPKPRTLMVAHTPVAHGLVMGS